MTGVRLMYGDCLERMTELEEKSIDLVLTDPPYGTTACKWDSVIPFEPLWEQIKRIRKDKSVIAILGSEPFSSFLRCSNIREFKYDWIWDKKVGSNFMSAKYQPFKEHEIVSVFYKKAGNYFPIKQSRTEKSAKRRACKDDWTGSTKAPGTVGRETVLKDFSHMSKLRYPRSIQAFNLDTFGGARASFHPTQKPVALLEYMIKTYTLPGQTVLDFTMGSGSTGVACVNTGRRFIGIEKDKKYFIVARDRIKETLKNARR